MYVLYVLYSWAYSVFHPAFAGRNLVMNRSPCARLVMYLALAELVVDCIRILLIAYAVYDLSQYCIRTTSEPANPLLDFTSDYLGELARYI